MNETFGDTGRISCAEAASLLENQFAEDPLSNQAAQRLQAHLATCRNCRRLVDWMSVLPIHANAHADRRFHAGLHTAYKEFVNNRASAKHRYHQPKIAMAIVAAALLVAVMFSRDWSAIFRSAPQGDDGATATIACLPVLPKEPVPGVLMTYCKDQAPAKIIENDGEITVRLKGGTIGMRIDPNRPHKRKVVVETPQGEVRVKGTLFTVQVDAHRSQLEVFRGVVEFIPAAFADQVLSVKAGQGADLRHRTVFALVSPQTALIRRVLDEEANRQSTRTSLSSEGNVPSSEPREERVALENSAPTELTNAAADRPSGTALPAKRDIPTIDRLIQEAQSCLIARDWGCASSRYEDLLTQYPKRPESTAALISLARIELSHLGRPTQALAHYQAYQQLAPDGPMAEEALFGIAVTFRRLGKTDLEQSTLRRFVEQFPNSSQLRRVRMRLRQLEPNE